MGLEGEKIRQERPGRTSIKPRARRIKDDMKRNSSRQGEVKPSSREGKDVNREQEKGFREVPARGTTRTKKTGGLNRGANREGSLRNTGRYNKKAWQI